VLARDGDCDVDGWIADGGGGCGGGGVSVPHVSACGGDGGIMMGVAVGMIWMDVLGCDVDWIWTYCVAVGGGVGYGQGDGDRARGRDELELVLELCTCKKISMSRGTRVPDRSSQSRIVSADAFGVVTRRI